MNMQLETRETFHFSVSTQPTKVNWDGINNYRKD